MATKKSLTMSMLAVLAAVSLSTAAVAQTPSQIRVHDHRTKTPSGTTTPGGARIPPPRLQTPSRKITVSNDRQQRQPPRRSGPYVPTLTGSSVNPHDHRTPTMSVAEASKMFSPYRQWKISGGPGTTPGGSISASSKYDQRRLFKLAGTVKGQFLSFSQHSGIDLGWVKDTRAGWAFYKESGVATALRYGEPFALRSDNSYQSYYLKYSKRTFGIDLTESRTISYEWAILGGRPGEFVRRDAQVVIYNLKHKEPMVYFDRRVGGDIGWRGSRRAGTGNIGDSPQYAKKFRAATRALLMPGVILGESGKR